MKKIIKNPQKSSKNPQKSTKINKNHNPSLKTNHKTWIFELIIVNLILIGYLFYFLKRVIKEPSWSQIGEEREKVNS